MKKTNSNKSFCPITKENCRNDCMFYSIDYLGHRLCEQSGILEIARALRSVFETPNECDSNLEAANVVDGLFAIARAIRSLKGENKAEGEEKK